MLNATWDWVQFSVEFAVRLVVVEQANGALHPSLTHFLSLMSNSQISCRAISGCSSFSTEQNRKVEFLVS